MHVDSDMTIHICKVLSVKGKVIDPCLGMINVFLDVIPVSMTLGLPRGLYNLEGKGTVHTCRLFDLCFV